MIRVNTIDELNPELRDRIRARVMRRVIDHLRERPHVEDAALRRVFGFDRAGLDALYEALSRSPGQQPADASGHAPGHAEAAQESVPALRAGSDEPVFADDFGDDFAGGRSGDRASERPAPPLPAARACCAARARD